MADTPEMSREEISSLLRFYAESGLDFPIADDVIDRFAAVETPQAALARPASDAPKATTPENGPHDPNAPAIIEMDPRKRKADAPPPVAQPTNSVTLPTEEVVAKAAAMADAAGDLDALKQMVETFDGCNLKRSARSTVFEGGNRAARVMVIGGAPSREDDVSGTAFSGADGILLEKMFGAIGLSRQDDVYYGFCVPWSPPGGAAPTPIHLTICAPFLAKQISLAAPELIIVMGNTAVRQVFQTKQTIIQTRGKWTTLPNFGLEAISMCEPAMLRDQPRLKRATWLDLLSLKAKLSD